MDNLEQLLQSFDSQLENKTEDSFLSNINISDLENDNFLPKDPEMEKDKKSVSKKYSDYGYEIHQRLKEKSRNSYDDHPKYTSSWKSKPSDQSKPDILSAPQPITKADVYAEPIFGLKLINPLVSSQVIQTKMVGRTPITLAMLPGHLNSKDKNVDWVFAGAIVFKSGLRTSQKGSQYCFWKISDLKHNLKQVTVYLFGKAGSELWKLALGTVVAILNPSTFNKDETVSKDDITLSIKNADQVMIWGMSRDYGICKAKKKNGENCTSFVNKSICEFCLYHVKAEYNKYTGKRFDLQASYSNGMTELRNKVLGKNEVFYGGKSYTALKLPPKSNKLKEKEKSILNHLSMNTPPQPLSSMQKMVNDDQKKLNKLEKSPLSNPNYRNEPKSSKPIVSARMNLMKEAGRKQIQTGEVTHISAVNLEKKKTFLSFASVFASESCDKPIQSANKESKTKENKPVSKKICDSEFDFGEIKTLKPCDEIIFDFDAPRVENTKSESKAIKSSKTGTNHPSLKSSDKKIKNVSTSSRMESYESNTRKALETCNFETIGISNNTDETDEPSVSNYLKSGMQAMLKRSSSRTEHSLHKQKRDQAKMNAIRLIKQKGGLERSNPNRVRSKSNDVKRTQAIKRALETDENEDSSSDTKSLVKSVLSERFIELMNTQSKHENLVQLAEDTEEQNYFNKMEKKEQLEEKMLNTYKVPCKAVTCLKCKYKWFSASDLCKSEGHPIKVIDAVKRFFQCQNCTNRTVSLEIVPLISCTNCGSSKWMRAGMIKNKVCSSSTGLSIRGDEVKHLDSFGQKPNLNLLVPE